MINNIFFETIISGDVLSRDAGTFAYVLLRAFTGGRWGSGIFTRVLVPQMIWWTKCNLFLLHMLHITLWSEQTSTSVRHRIFEHFTTTLQQGSTTNSIFHVFPWSMTIISSLQVLIIGGGDGGVLREVVKHSCVEKALPLRYFQKLNAFFQELNFHGRKFRPTFVGFASSLEVSFHENAVGKKHPSSWILFFELHLWGDLVRDWWWCCWCSQAIYAQCGKSSRPGCRGRVWWSLSS